MVKSPQVIVDRYKRGIETGGQAYTDGVRSTNKSWSGGLMANKSRMVSGYQNAMNNGTFDRGVQNTGDSGWVQKTVEKAANYSGSVGRAVAGYTAQVQNMVAVLSEVEARVAAMPSNTEAEREARALANMRGIREAWARRRGTF